MMKFISHVLLSSVLLSSLVVFAATDKDANLELQYSIRVNEHSWLDAVKWGALGFLSPEDISNLRSVTKKARDFVDSEFNTRAGRERYAQYYFKESNLGNWLSVEGSVKDLVKAANAIMNGNGEKALERLHELHAKFSRYGFSGFVPTEDKNEQIADVWIQCTIWFKLRYKVSDQVWSMKNGQVRVALKENRRAMYEWDNIWEGVWYEVWEHIWDELFILVVKDEVCDHIWDHVWGGALKSREIIFLVIGLAKQRFRGNNFELVSSKEGELSKKFKKVITYCFMIYQYAIRQLTLSQSLRKYVAKMIAKYNINIDFKKLMKILDDGIELATQSNYPVLVTQLETFKYVLPKVSLINSGEL